MSGEERAAQGAGEGGSRPPVALTIAGSDPSGGAGIQADLKSFSALGAYGCAVLTALTAQSTQGVTGVHPVPPEFVREQVATLVDDVRLDAAKIGMLASAPIVEAVTAAVDDLLDCPVVLDPVMVSTSGSRLLDDDAVDAVRRLAPHTDLVTPNLYEAAVLLGTEVAESLEDQQRQADSLLELGIPRVLVKGGHGSGPEAVDVYADSDGQHVLRQPRVDTPHTHGTGCTLSAAIAALLPQRDGDWVRAVADARAYLTAGLEAGRDLQIGHGSGPVHHFHQWW
ncbi:bifunctional hydroxymethylpyrimidine kinase/phosphomethylpyrimidine kinase [Barrientosiimonas endolithica]|uniref:bifunctional hydroxymethylpyrimidine kinase/phosphomethylpyrimidine kinase n=1 Tax=Barrientosiimonas endolithica TaxID=1535208 RepID=UPI00259BAACA|nr:bifunctional hydroxymethylpyrimidine kinase/phosphomethylpyrimidine kinase [Barrientosiimonas endolithica]